MQDDGSCGPDIERGLQASGGEGAVEAERELDGVPGARVGAPAGAVRLERERREALALRANLRLRKAQVQGRTGWSSGRETV